MRHLLSLLLVGLPLVAWAQSSPSDSPAETHVPLTITGGHDTVGVDRGRPVILVAAALNVPPEVFREAFSHVKPAGPGEQPEPDQVHKNKQALMSALGPYGVTNDRLNEVSNYYRYRRSDDEIWRHVDAAGFASVRNGVVTAVTITNPGAGYSSVPTVSVTGMDKLQLTPTLAFTTDLKTNGSIKSIALPANP